VTELTGRVVVVAGAEAAVGPVAAALHSAGASVALVALAETARTDVTVHVRADPADADVWARVAMHVEQHLGPVDAAVADSSAEARVRDAFAADLRRRGHGDVVVVRPGDDIADVVTWVAGTQ
jgi:hypothetical protein